MARADANAHDARRGRSGLVSIFKRESVELVRKTNTSSLLSSWLGVAAHARSCFHVSFSVFIYCTNVRVRAARVNTHTRKRHSNRQQDDVKYIYTGAWLSGRLKPARAFWHSQCFDSTFTVGWRGWLAGAARLGLGRIAAWASFGRPTSSSRRQSTCKCHTRSHVLEDKYLTQNMLF